MTGSRQILEMEPCKLPQKLATGFSEVLKDINGAGYELLLYCATQLVNATNHMIICKQTLVVNPPKENIVKMTLNEAFDGEISIATIDSII